MDFDPTTHPSRMFIRFSARNQLTADITGRPIAAVVKRLDGETYIQRATPEKEAIAEDNLSDFSGNLGRDTSNTPEADDPSGGSSRNTQPLYSQAEISASAANQNASNDGEDCEENCQIDEVLFREIVKTRFNRDRYPELYQACETSRAAKEIETKVAAEIVASYRQIKRQQACPTVQSLNKLL